MREEKRNREGEGRSRKKGARQKQTFWKRDRKEGGLTGSRRKICQTQWWTVGWGACLLKEQGKLLH